MVKVVCTYTLTEEQLGRIKNRLGDRAELVKVKDFDEAGDVLSETRVLLTNQLAIDQKDLEKMKNLEWIQCVFSGINHFPLGYLRDKGIILTNARGVHRIQMSEFIVSLLLSIVRRSYHYTKAHLSRKWDPIKIDELYGKTIGFIGVGAVARETARKLRPFDVRILGVKNSVEPVENFDEVYGGDGLDKLLEESDFVITLVPLTEETRGMIGEDQFRRDEKDRLVYQRGPGAHSGREGPDKGPQGRLDSGGGTGRIREGAAAGGKPAVGLGQRDNHPAYSRAYTALHGPADGFVHRQPGGFC